MIAKKLFFLKSHQGSARGFTLIELLVVIAIIGLLSGISVVALNVARIKARDGRRQADLAQVRLALEFYFDDETSYPAAACDTDQPTTAGWTSLETALETGNYISDVPIDPRNTGDYVYKYCAYNENQKYRLWYKTENDALEHLIESL